MTLVLLGTQNNDFHRILDEIEKNIKNGNIKDEVIVQAGFTKYKSEYMKIFDLIPKEQLEDLIKKADLVISHAGVGSIEMALEHNKKIIAVPRLKKYGEHVNDHQKEIKERFSKYGYIIGIDDVADLNNAIKNIKQFIPIKYENNNKENIANIIKTFIDKI